MSLKMNFFPLHFVLSLLLLIAGVIANAEVIFLYMESNIYLNGFIIALFAFAILWALGVLSYYSRTSRTFNRLLTSVSSPLSTGGEGAKTKKQALYVASNIAGTLVDSPAVSKILSSSMKSGKLSVSYADSLVVLTTIREAGARVLAPVKFIAGIFTILGLLGTFVGLLETIDGVGNALAAVSDVANLDILALVKLFADPLKGMSIAFSASLFALVSSLVSNYAVFVCEHKLAEFCSKLQNYLTAGIAIVDVDPNKIEAKDILISLDESFSKLYNGIAERLDVIADGIFAMSKIIVRTQERQDRLFNSMTDHYDIVASFSDRLPDIIEYLAAIPKVSEEIESVLNRNCDDLMNYLDANVVKLLNVIAGATVDNADISDEIAEVAGIISANTLEVSDTSKKSLSVQERMFPVITDISGQIDTVISLADQVSTDLTSSLEVAMEQKNHLSDIVMRASEGVSVLLDIATINAVQSQSLADILGVSNVSSSLLDEIDQNLKNVYQVDLDISKGVADSLSVLNKLFNTSVNILNSNVSSRDSLFSLDAKMSDVVTSLVDEVNLFLDARKVLYSLDDKMRSVVSGDYRSTIDLIAKNSSVSNSILQGLSQGVSFISDKLVSSSSELNVNFESLLNGVYLSNELSNSIFNKMVAVDYSDYLNDIAYELEGYRDYISDFSNRFSGLNEKVDLIVSSNDDTVASLVGVRDALYDTNNKSNDAVDMVRSEIVVATDKLEELLVKTVHSDDLLNGVSDLLSEVSSSVSVLSSVRSNMETSNNILSSIAENSLSERQFLSSLEEVGSVLSSSNASLGAINDRLKESNGTSADLLSNTGIVLQSLDRMHDVLQNVDNSALQTASAMNDNTSQLREVAANIHSSSNTITMMSQEVGVLSGLVSDAMVKFSNMSDSVQADMSAFASNFIDFKERFDFIIASFQSNVESLAQASGVADMLRQEVAELSSAVSAVAPYISNLVGATFENATQTAQLFKAFGGFNNALQSIDEKSSVQLSALEKLSQQLYSSHEASLGFMSNVGRGFDSIQAALVDSSNKKQDLISVMNSVVSDFSQLRDSYSQEIIRVSQGLEAALNNIMNSFSYITSNASDFGGMISHLSRFVEENSASAKSNAQVLDRISNGMQQALTLQGNYFVELSGVIKEVNNSVVSAARNFSDRLGAYEDALQKQVVALQGVDYNLSNIDEYRNGFLREISSRYADMETLISNVSQSFLQAASSLSNVHEVMYKQLEISDVNARASQLVSDNLTAIYAVSENIRDVGAKIISVSPNFKDLSNNIESFKEVLSGRGSEFASFAGKLSDDLTVLSAFLDTFLLKFGNNSSMNSIYEESAKLVDSVALFVNKFEDFAKKSLNKSEDLKQAFSQNVNRIQSTISDFTDRLPSELATVALSNLKNNSAGLDELKTFLKDISAPLNKVLVNSERDANIYNRISEALDKINQVGVDESLKLNLIANAIDSLITEILNSRDISEAILEVLNSIASNKTTE